jgi:hypothetical protein
MNVLDDLGITPTPPMPRATCDGPDCGAQAFVFALVNGTELSYCSHHGTEYFEKLAASGHIIWDLRHAHLQP